MMRHFIVLIICTTLILCNCSSLSFAEDSPPPPDFGDSVGELDKKSQNFYNGIGAKDPTGNVQPLENGNYKLPEGSFTGKDGNKYSGKNLVMDKDGNIISADEVTVGEGDSAKTYNGVKNIQRNEDGSYSFESSESTQQDLSPNTKLTTDGSSQATVSDNSHEAVSVEELTMENKQKPSEIFHLENGQKVKLTDNGDGTYTVQVGDAESVVVGFEDIQHTGPQRIAFKDLHDAEVDVGEKSVTVTQNEDGIINLYDQNKNLITAHVAKGNKMIIAKEAEPRYNMDKGTYL